MNWAKNNIYFLFDIDNKIDMITYDRDLESFLAIMYHNGEYKIVISILS